MGKMQEDKPKALGWKWSVLVFIGSIILIFVVLPGIRRYMDPNKYEGEELCIVSENGEYFFVNFENKMVTAEKYDYIDCYHEGHYRYLQNKKWGFMNGTLEVCVEADYDDCGSFYNELAPVSKDNKWWYIDLYHEKKIEGPFEWAGEFYKGKAIVKKDKHFFIIDKSGKQLEGPFEEGFASAKKDGKWGVINEYGEFVVPCEYDFAIYAM